MPSYIYIASPRTDPGAGSRLDDPLFGPVPTLGACVPNLRRLVTKGDWLFVVSGKRQHRAQYIIGGLRVQEKISAIAAYKRFPQYRLRLDDDGHVVGNIPVDGLGNKHDLDTHDIEGFDRRAENYLVGDRSVELSNEAGIEVGRERTLRFLAELKEKQGNRVVDVIGRASKLEREQVAEILSWFDEVKRVADGQRRR